jgi:hypothetical protein
MSWGVDFGWKGVVLIDGGISAAWRVRRDGKSAVMRIESGRQLTGDERTELEGEAERLMAFVAADAAARSVELVAAG